MNSIYQKSPRGLVTRKSKVAVTTLSRTASTTWYGAECVFIACMVSDQYR